MKKRATQEARTPPKLMNRRHTGGRCRGNEKNLARPKGTEKDMIKLRGENSRSKELIERQSRSNFRNRQGQKDDQRKDKPAKEVQEISTNESVRERQRGENRGTLYFCSDGCQVRIWSC